MSYDRIKLKSLLDKVITAEQAAQLFENGMIVGSSGFTKAGDSKVVLPALADRAKTDPLKITLITGASLGHGTDGKLAEAGVLAKRMPFQVDRTLRGKINSGEVLFIDQHLSETAELLHNKNLASVDIAVLEVAAIEADGSIIPTTSVGNSATFAALAKHVILEINTAVPMEIRGIHDIYQAEDYPRRNVIPIVAPENKIGRKTIALDPSKVVGIVFTDIEDSPADIAEPDTKTTAIASHILNFFEKEVEMGHLSSSLLPLQAGIGKVANAVLMGFKDSNFRNLTMFSEVLQDSTFDLIDAGVMDFASASSITVSKPCYDRVFGNLDKYRDKMVLRPQNISNTPGLIRRLGVIAINTAIEFDIYGNVNSTHISGTNIMNGIGGSGDFARNAYLSIFVTQAASKEDRISHVLPMVSHVDHTEHDVDILVTDIGLADLRGLAPRERAQVIIDNCVHPDYKEQLQDYYDRACERGGHTPHILEEAFSWHVNLRDQGSMKK
ncbi:MULTISPECIES: succinate CoA transferase [Sphingobacterium]|jgi:succinyl-CoA:acetate CoA-transferase|uniref:Succinate CoA transferase n=2 Tax=Sphingobacterium TaxID=28453 RepID=A0ABW5Z3D2_9SPHI|nr:MULTISPECIES: succinate CoA transferase [Sphingobacterium]KKX48986.1 acetyl-CoA hydrolase [Sphingobacterium sp. IITKGP-BTPF85]MBB2952664.1 acetyl-CoA hydrolase/succinyl-CoA:acetate CoA-transferase [Sphingobacterium sp. JUb56]MCS3556051.1 acetyl-CoA hydrolase/succinyl-CoA:acetate CoA-transferase [Sphingobacterium sp. JUb21]MCW2261128.1 acetyl-CoA hydrolase/succinyl-CoA:acetate CoA-transferase [Sphingobacterium kitahiroshimense]NJI76231.1 succinate CoA transferase [Sphingobacterium sp. B16(20